MKRSLALLFTALLLTFSLTACGREQQPNDDANGGANDGVNDDISGGSDGDVNNDINGGSNGDVNNDINGGDAVTGGDPMIGSGNSGGGIGDDGTAGTGDIGPAGGSVGGDAETAGGSLAGSAAGAVQRGIHDLTDGAARMGGASYQQMVRNARVHDSDGDLTDHENSVTPGSAF